MRYEIRVMSYERWVMSENAVCYAGVIILEDTFY